METSGRLRRRASALIEAMRLVIRVELALRRNEFAVVLRQIDATRPAAPPPSIDMPARSFERAIAVAYRVLPFTGSCLKTSLVFLLHRRRRGLPAELRIGVQKCEDMLAAHAWVEDGRGGVLTDPQSGFSSLPPLVPRDRSSSTID
jgi:hypothetical protein